MTLPSVPNRRARVVAWIALVVLVSCARPTEDVVVRIAGADVTVDEFEAYLSASLDDDWGEDALDADERDLVHSRLFDAFVEERILLQEADRLGVGVSDAEVDAFLEADRVPGDTAEGEGPSVEEDPRRRATALRTLRIQKLIDRSAHPAAEVGDAEVDAWLRQIGGAAPESSEIVALRALLLPSREAADRVSSEIRRRRMTFDEAVAQHEPTPGQADTAEMALADLPAPVREAVAKLAVGGVSRPVELHGEIFLFRVIRRGGPDPDDHEPARARARRDLQEHRYLQASRRVLEDLRQSVEIERFPEHLPFRYVPDEGGP
jgi:peptidyl-prolyl cis-trans isomerase SurA